MPNAQHLVFIVAIAFIGTMNSTTGDIGVHVPLEHAALANRASAEDRTRVFARYSLIGAFSIAAGALAAGAAGPARRLGMDKTAALQAMFYLYAALGLVGAALYAQLPHGPRRRKPKPRTTALGPSRKTVYKLAALFSLDSFAGGFAVQSLMALWLFERFELSLAAASIFFFWSNVLTAFSYPVAARLGAALRPRQYDGVHAHPVEPLPHRSRRSRPISSSSSRCCWCAPRSRRWTCRRARPT